MILSVAKHIVTATASDDACPMKNAINDIAAMNTASSEIEIIVDESKI